jgi:hypothetical protein
MDGYFSREALIIAIWDRTSATHEGEPATLEKALIDIRRIAAAVDNTSVKPE